MRAARWHRRSIAAVAVAVAVFALVSALQPRNHHHVTVVVAAASLPGGQVLEASHLTTLSMPAEAMPAEAITDPAAAVGQVLVAPVTERSIITQASIASGQGLARPGFVVASLPLADAALASLLRAGARIDIIAPSSTGATTLASDVRVVQINSPPSTGLTFEHNTRVALVEVTPNVATKLAQAATAGGVTIAVR